MSDLHIERWARLPGGGFGEVPARAKCMECVELAPAFWATAAKQSDSKLDALHTLRAVQLGFCGPGSGFTLIELPALVAMITILAWIRYDRHGKRSNYEYTDGHAARLSRAGARADQYLDHRVRFPLTNPPE